MARGYTKALGLARHLIYVEDQYLWSDEVSSVFARALRTNPGLRLVAVLPHFPDQDSRLAMPPSLIAREGLIDRLSSAAPGRWPSTAWRTGPEHPSTSTPRCASSTTSGQPSVRTTSTAARGRMTRSSTAAVCDPEFARSLRTMLAQEHLGLDDGTARSLGLGETYDAYAGAAAALQRWQDSGGTGPRPPGQLRPLARHRHGPLTRAWASAVYRGVYDPDGRPLALRHRRSM